MLFCCDWFCGFCPKHLRAVVHMFECRHSSRKNAHGLFNWVFLVLKQVSVSGNLYDFIHYLWLSEAPVGELQ